MPLLSATNPAYTQRIASQHPTRAALIAEANRIISSSGNTMAGADAWGLRQQYWKLVWEGDVRSYYEMFSRKLSWGAVRRSTLYCVEGKDCALRVFGPVNYEFVEIVGVKDQAAAQRLAAVIAGLSKNQD